ncbi:uncharacterized protein [Linepithema humile]|uniref:uncharacterized protein isoform X2 n=1 Tax=Linepithema humile TaxID=83485 RepID=UPI0006236482|nr:PREDICTED: uncharacterized protein LOC105668545 [Linepithema humile]
MFSGMENIESFIKIMQQKRLAAQHELDRLDEEHSKENKLMKKLRDLRNEREHIKENITKHLNTMTAHKHSIHKIIHSSKDISGLPVSHDCAQDVKTMFIDGIEFLNNIGETCKTLNNAEENNVDSSKLIEAVTTCTESVESELYQTRCSIAQLDTLKDNTALLQEHISENSVNSVNSDEV